MSSWFSKLKNALGKSANKIGTGITQLFSHKRLDEESLEELEDLLIASDLGPETAANICQQLASKRMHKEITADEVKEELAKYISDILRPVALNLEDRRYNFLDACRKATNGRHFVYTILVAGVNGNGKTTSIGKLAWQYRQIGLKVMVAACDSFRAAAVEQLQEWGRRADVPVVAGEVGADPASIAYRAMQEAEEGEYDVLLIDTAGRLQNQDNLMAQLEKISRVIRKAQNLDERLSSNGDDIGDNDITDQQISMLRAPHERILVLDATTGQNAISQAEHFGKAIDLTGLIVTKLDGTAKGGVIVSLAQKFGINIYAIGVGEAIEDLRNFDADEFAGLLVGAEQVENLS